MHAPDEVVQRIARRGRHVLTVDRIFNAAEIADAVRACRYIEGRKADELSDVLLAREIIWAPDGDAAFDDGGHVLQFDLGDTVRLVAFKNEAHDDDFIKTVVEAHVPSDRFYGVLEEWRSAFETDRLAALSRTAPH